VTPQSRFHTHGAWNRPPPSEAPPERLCRFVASEWPDGGVDAWRVAALAWLDGDPARRLPFGEYGDAVAVFRESARIKRALA
jgi:hypothetical protein